MNKFDDAVNVRLDSIGCTNCTGVMITMNPDDGTFTIEGYRAKLSKTADGVPVGEGDVVFGLIGETVVEFIAGPLFVRRPAPYHPKTKRLSDCYSTREAAEAAKAGEK